MIQGESCNYLEICPIFQRFHSDESAIMWIKMYCQGPRCDVCARKKLAIAKKNVPITLLPNGIELESLKNEVLQH